MSPTFQLHVLDGENIVFCLPWQQVSFHGNRSHVLFIYGSHTHSNVNESKSSPRLSLVALRFLLRSIGLTSLSIWLQILSPSGPNRATKAAFSDFHVSMATVSKFDEFSFIVTLKPTFVPNIKFLPLTVTP